MTEIEWFDHVNGVSGLRPSMDLLSIPQVICGHTEPPWNDIDRGNRLIRKPELSGNPTSRVISSKQEELGKGNDEFGLAKYFCSHFPSDFYMPWSLTTWGLWLYVLSEGRRAVNFLRQSLRACCIWIMYWNTSLPFYKKILQGAAHSSKTTDHRYIKYSDFCNIIT
jgi:hypothetical protein